MRKSICCTSRFRGFLSRMKRKIGFRVRERMMGLSREPISKWKSIEVVRSIKFYAKLIFHRFFPFREEKNGINSDAVISCFESFEVRSRPNRIIVVYNNPSIMLSGNNLNYLNNLSKGNRLSGRWTRSHEWRGYFEWR